MADNKKKDQDLTLAEATAEYERAVAENPGDGQMRFNLGSAYYANGKRDAAIREFEQALAISPSFHQARYYLGVLYAQRGDKDNARKELEQVMNGSAQMMLKNQAKIRIGLLGL
jgi:tetratricopeptide (TPR) repeat protein